MNEPEKYRFLMLGFHRLADDEALTDTMPNESGLVVGSRTPIREILANMAAVINRTVFDADDIEVVKKAFTQQKKRYPGDVISDCVAVLLGLKP